MASCHDYDDSDYDNDDGTKMIMAICDDGAILHISLTPQIFEVVISILESSVVVYLEMWDIISDCFWIAAMSLTARPLSKLTRTSMMKKT